MTSRIFPMLMLTLCVAGKMAAAPDQEWARAVHPWDWQWPRDHGAHPDYKTEWWYFTGNLQVADGREFGYQLTFFRQGVQPVPAQKQSAWALRDFHFAHFTITDVSAQKFHAFERVERGVMGLSGTVTGQMGAWLREWRLDTIRPDAYRLQAREGAIAIDFDITAVKPLVLEGIQGLSQKADGAGNASYYYSYSRLKTTGALTLGDHVLPVQGTSWFDHEFSTSSLGPNQVGWDWFSLQFSTGEEAMIYLLRNQDGSIDPNSSGTWIHTDGTTTHLPRKDMEVEALDFWVSPHTGAKYPSRWHIRIPGQQAELEVVPKLADQELVLSGLGKLAYWEGACAIRGTLSGRAITGAGYTELTGYAARLSGK